MRRGIGESGRKRTWTQAVAESTSNSDSESESGQSDSSETSSDESSDDEPPRKKTDDSEPVKCRMRPFQAMMAESFNNIALADVKVFINDLHLPAHSFVLAAQSEHFKQALTKGFKEEAAKEFRFNESHPHPYWRMFEYLYKGTYSIEPPQEISEADDEIIQRHIRVYSVAEAFCIDGLRRLSTERFKQCMKKYEQMDDNFVSCIRLIFQATTVPQNELRKEAMDIVGSHALVLWQMNSFQLLVREGGDFVVDFAARLVEDL